MNDEILTNRKNNVLFYRHSTTPSVFTLGSTVLYTFKRSCLHISDLASAIGNLMH